METHRAGVLLIDLSRGDRPGTPNVSILPPTEPSGSPSQAAGAVADSPGRARPRDTVVVPVFNVPPMSDTEFR